MSDIAGGGQHKWRDTSMHQHGAAYYDDGEGRDKDEVVGKTREVTLVMLSLPGGC